MKERKAEYRVKYVIFITEGKVSLISLLMAYVSPLIYRSNEQLETRSISPNSQYRTELSCIERRVY